MIRNIISLWVIAGFCTFGAVEIVAQKTSAPTLKYVMTFHADFIPPVPVAENRLIFDVTGGWVKTAHGGSGTVVTPCGDWLDVLPNGTFKLDVRCNFKMDDGSTILAEYTGRIKLSETGAAKFQNGETVSGNDFYFITSPTMQTTSEKYAWVNDAVFVGKGVEIGGGPTSVTYDVYMVVP